MPLIEHMVYPDRSESGIWKIEESKEELMHHLDLSKDERKEMERFSWHQRQLQWLAVRWLLFKMSGRSLRGKVFKDTSGKPNLAESEFNITLSHSHAFVAAAAAPYPVGVDIQVKSERMRRIIQKFADEKELQACQERENLNLAHIIWSAKECMFKAFGQDEVSFSKHLHVSKPEEIHCQEARGEFKGQVHKGDEIMTFDFVFSQDDEKVFVLGKSVEGQSL
ncbi:MAG TPA: 4'-phosphopantetheinyl transferase superfamily protein [Saprospiraceae bacterium]|nr:4'-phosphopantetheinyl transferase superfamily protein [Saprospiraceae bacterium]